jgi:hypothetical protein
MSAPSDLCEHALEVFELSPLWKFDGLSKVCLAVCSYNRKLEHFSNEQCLAYFTQTLLLEVTVVMFDKR